MTPDEWFFIGLMVVYLSVLTWQCFGGDDDT